MTPDLITEATMYSQIGNGTPCFLSVLGQPDNLVGISISIPDRGVSKNQSAATSTALTS
jgi:hypothetical protein